MKATVRTYSDEERCTSVASVEGESRFVTLNIETKNGVKYEVDIEVINEDFGGSEILINARMDESDPTYYQVGIPCEISFSKDGERVVESGVSLVARRIRSEQHLSGIWVNWLDAKNSHSKNS